MAALHLTFEANLTKWVAETKARTLAVYRESVQRTVNRAQQYLSGELVKVQTGFLRASIRASDTPGVPIIENKTGAPIAYDPGSITVVIAGAGLENPLYVMYTANYAAAVHNGTSKMVARPWVAFAAAQWPYTVRQVCAEAKALAESGNKK